MNQNKLVGKAAQFVNNDPILANESYFPTLWDRLIERFTKCQFPQELQSKISNLRYDQNETVKQLADRITSVVKKYACNPNNSLELENVEKNC